MPFRPPRPCRHPGCPALVRGRDSYCPEHLRVHTWVEDPGRGSAASRGYGGAWRKIRKAFLAAFPLCSDIHGVHARRGEVALATDVDHILPLKEGGTNDWSNLRSLCHSCHSRRTSRDSRRRGSKISRGLPKETNTVSKEDMPAKLRVGGYPCEDASQSPLR